MVFVTMRTLCVNFAIYKSLWNVPIKNTAVVYICNFFKKMN
jgi:hypothetical protein